MHSNNTQSNCKQENIYKIKVTTQALEAHQVKQQITSTGWPLVFVSVVPSVCPVSLFLRFKPAHIENSPGTCSCAENRLLVSIRWETSHALLLTKAYVDRERRISDYEQIYRIRGPGATRVTDSEISNLQVAVIPAYVLGHECCRAIQVLSDQSFNITFFLRRIVIVVIGFQLEELSKAILQAVTAVIRFRCGMLCVHIYGVCIAHGDVRGWALVLVRYLC